MSYIGRGTESISNVEVLDNLTFNGSASYTLQKSSVNFVPSSANNLLISISGVVQQGNFSVSGSTITFDTTVSASDTCDWILHYGTGLITTVADGAITEAKLGSNAVTTAKINDSAITSAKINNGAVSYAKTDGNFGKIGQVVSTTVNTPLSIGVSTTKTDITGLSASITPSSTSSKILVLHKIQMSNASGGNGTIHLIRNTTEIGNGGSGSGLSANTSMNFANSNSYWVFDFGGSFLDSPSSTSALTYKFQVRNEGSYTVYFNRSARNGGVDINGISTITLMEVLA